MSPAPSSVSPGPDDELGSDRLEELIHRHPEVVALARVGWAAKGVVYLVTGVIAFTIAVNPFGEQETASNGEADPSGAVATIAEQPFGEVLLWMLAAGLALYCVWRLVTVVLPAELDAHAVLRRIGYTVSAATYAVLGVAAVSLAMGSRSSGGGASGSRQDTRVTEITESVLDWTGGRWLVGLAGVVVVAIGGYFAWKGVSGSFEQQLEHRRVGPFSWSVVRSMGRAGWVGRAVMMALIGVFVTRAAIQFDPSEAKGLDDSLRRVADDTGGMVLVVIVALGLTLYGSFCIVSTPVRRLVASDDDSA